MKRYINVLILSAFMMILVAPAFAYTADDFFTTLIEHKADLSGGHVVFEVKNPTASSITIDPNTLKYVMNEMPSATQTISVRYFSLEKTNVTENSQSCQKISKGTAANGSQITKMSCIDNQVTTEKDYWKTFSSALTIPAGQTKRFRVEIRYKAKIGLNSRDWIPSLDYSGNIYEQKKWAWFNTSWDFRRNLTITSTPRLFELIEINLTEAGVVCNPANCSDIRITDSSGDTLIPFQVITNNQTNGRNTSYWSKYGNDNWTIFRIVNTSYNSYYIYYGNPNAVDASSTLLIWQDDFEKYAVGTPPEYTFRVSLRMDVQIEGSTGLKGLQNGTIAGNPQIGWNLSGILGRQYGNNMTIIGEHSNTTFPPSADNPNFIIQMISTALDGSGGYRVPQILTPLSTWEVNTQGGAPTCNSEALNVNMTVAYNLTSVRNGTTVHFYQNQTESCRIEDSTFTSGNYTSWARGSNSALSNTLRSIRFFETQIIPYTGLANYTFGAEEVIVIDVTGCQILDSEAVTYRLMNSFTIDRNPCLYLNANSIILNGQNFIITGNQSQAAIFMGQSSGSGAEAIVRHLIIRNVAEGVFINRSVNANLTNITVRNSRIGLTDIVRGTIVNGFYSDNVSIGINSSISVSASRITNYTNFVISNFTAEGIRLGNINGQQFVFGRIEESGAGATHYMRDATVNFGSSLIQIVNLTIREFNGSVQFLPTFAAADEITSDPNLTIGNPSFRNNRIQYFTRSQLNRTSIVTFTNVPYASATGIQVLTDINQDGTYETCTAPQCTNITLSGSTLRFNVTRWSSYSSIQALQLNISPVNETSNQTFRLNLTSVGISSANAIHVYDSNRSTGIQQLLNSTLAIFNVTRLIRLVEANNTFLNHSWLFNVTFTDANFSGNINTSNASQAVYWAYYPEVPYSNPQSTTELLPIIFFGNMTNLSIDSRVSLASNVTFNSVATRMNFDRGISNSEIFNVTITAPNINVYEQNFTWNTTLFVTFNGITISRLSPNAVQSVLNANLTPCAATSLRAFNFTFIVEETDVILAATTVGGNFEATFDIFQNILGDLGSVNATFDLSGSNSHVICLQAPISSFKVNSHIRYLNESFSTRHFFHENNNVSNITQFVRLYVLSTGDSSPIKFDVRESDGLTGASGVRIEALRYYPDQNLYRIVGMGLTDGEGMNTIFLKMNTVYHKFRLFRNGVFLKEISQGILGGSSITAGLTLTFSLDLTTLVNVLNFYLKTDTSCTSNNNTGIVTCTYNDSSQELDQASLSVQRFSRGQYNRICNVNSTALSGTLTCNVSGQGNGTYYFALTGTFDTVLVKLEEGSFTLGPRNIFGSTGLLFAAFMLITLVMLGSFNPVVTIFMGIVALVMSFLMGMLDVSVSALIGIIIAGIITAIKSRG